MLKLKPQREQNKALEHSNAEASKQLDDLKAQYGNSKYAHISKKLAESTVGIETRKLEVKALN
jgi:hypothetical protein